MCREAAVTQTNYQKEREERVREMSYGVKIPKVKASSTANTNVGRSHNRGIFVASAGLLPDCLFVFPTDGDEQRGRNLSRI